MKLSDAPPAAFLGLAAARFVIGVLAIPLAPFLYREHFIVLVLMRPTKEVLLAAGFFVRAGDVNLLAVLTAAVPLVVLGVWLFFYVGRAYCDEILEGQLPGIGGRLVDSERVRKLQEVLDKQGRRLIFLGRLAIFPSALVAAAAGAGKMSAREFLPIDALGALTSVALTVGAGYLAGETYEEAGPWLTAIGLAALVAAAALLGRYLRRV